MPESSADWSVWSVIEVTEGQRSDETAVYQNVR